MESFGQSLFLYYENVCFEEWNEERYSWLQINQDNTLEYNDFLYPLVFINNDSVNCIHYNGIWELETDTLTLLFENGKKFQYKYTSSGLVSLYDFDWTLGVGDDRVFTSCIYTLGNIKPGFNSVTADSLNNFISQFQEVKRKKYCR